ncbi:hypothetical protein Bca4012_037740 [Brassica carinata]
MEGRTALDPERASRAPRGYGRTDIAAGCVVSFALDEHPAREQTFSLRSGTRDTKCAGWKHRVGMGGRTEKRYARVHTRGTCSSHGTPVVRIQDRGAGKTMRVTLSTHSTRA